MRISVAQLHPVSGDIALNIEKHKKLAELAASLGASAVFFPELSVTGYEPELADALATEMQDSRFDTFQALSDSRQITLGIGMPTKSAAGIYITMLIFRPGSFRQAYSKQLLHEDELPYFVQGGEQLILDMGHEKLAPAICYESLQPAHAEKAMQLGGKLYLASVAKSQNGLNKAMVRYPEVAEQYAVPVLMSNCTGFCDNFMSAGQSAVWTKDGKLAAQLNDTEEAVLVFDTETERVETARL